MSLSLPKCFKACVVDVWVTEGAKRRVGVHQGGCCCTAWALHALPLHSFKTPDAHGRRADVKPYDSPYPSAQTAVRGLTPGAASQRPAAAHSAHAARQQPHEGEVQVSLQMSGNSTYICTRSCHSGHTRQAKWYAMKGENEPLSGLNLNTRRLTSGCCRRCR